MSAEFLRALDADVRRLLTAGITAVAQDAGLRRQARTLRGLAEQAPALRPLSERLSRVLAGRSVSAANLLDLALMTSQVRAGLACAGVSGPIDPLPKSGPWSTTIPAADLERPVRWLVRPSWDDSWKDTRFFLMRHADLRLVGLLLVALQDKGAEVAEFAAERLAPHHGSALMPELLSVLERADRRSRRHALLAICHTERRLGAELCRRRLEDADFSVRRDALRCLTVAAPDEARAVALAWLEGRPPKSVREAAWECLYAVRPLKAHDLPSLLAALPTGERSCVAVVASVGRPAVRPVTGLLGSDHLTVRVRAAAILGQLGTRARTAVPALIELTRDSAEQVAVGAIEALAKIGPAARPAVPQLVELVSGYRSAEPVADAAADALVDLGRDDPAAVAALVAMLDSKDYVGLVNSVRRVGELGPAASAAVPRLIARYRDRRCHWQFRRDILEALAGIGSGARAAVSLLKEALRDREMRVRYAAAVALAMTGPGGKAAVPVLLEALHDEQESWWWEMYGLAAMRALGALGPEAAAAVPDLEEIARSDWKNGRRLAARDALARINGSG
jgi:HEAT repeat protein